MNKPKPILNNSKLLSFLPTPGLTKHARFSLVLLLLLIISTHLYAQTSDSNGDWVSPGTWIGNIPTATDNATLNHEVTIQSGTSAEVNDLTINADGKVIVYGTLIVNNNMTMNFQGNNESEFEIKPNSVVIVKGDVYLTTKVSLNLSSYFIVLGNLDAQSSSNNTDVNIDDASIYVFGTVGDKIDLDTCSSYDGLTEDNNENCHIGTETAYDTNVDNGTVPSEIDELINTCTPPSFTLNPSTSEQNYCVGESSNSLTVSASGDGLTYQWYSDDDSTPEEGDENPVGTNSNSFIPPTSSPGTTYYYCVVTGDCGTATSNVSGAITVFNTTIVSGELGGEPVYTYCEGRNPYPINAGEPSGGDGNYTYQWQQSEDCSGTWIDAVAQDGVTDTQSFNPPALSDTICYQLRITDGCGNEGFSEIKSYNIVPDPISPEINPTPSAATSVCTGQTVSATFEPGSGGLGTVTDVYQYSTDGGSNWSNYTPGTAITATAEMVGTDMIQIRTRREASETGCDDSDWNTVSWSVFETPTAVISEDTAICDDGSTAALSINFTGTGPWDVTIQRDGANDFNISNINDNPHTFNVSDEGTYTISAINNANCTGSASGSATVVVNPLPTATISSTNSPICSGENAEFNLTGTAEATVTYSLDGGSSQNTVVLSGGSAVVSVPSPASDTTITLISVADANCSQSLNEEATVTVNDIPNNTTAGFSGNTICEGETGVLNFNAINSTFISTYTIEYTDGATIWSQEITDPGDFTFDVAENPTATTSYSLVSITNGNGCIRTSGFGDSTAQITVEPTPIAGTLIKSPDATSVCTGTDVSAEFTAGSGGNETDELEYSTDGGINWSVYSSGTAISTTGLSEVNIRTRRLADYCDDSDYNSVSWTINKFNMVVSDETSTPSGNHCPEFGGPFNPDNSDYNAGVTEVIFKVTKDESTTGNWTFDFAIDETGNVEVYDLVSVKDNNDNTISYSGDDDSGNLDAGDNTEVIFTFWIVNRPGNQLDVKFAVSNGNDGICVETGIISDNNEIHTINAMPVIGNISP